jgi:hypothetical protein
MLLSFLGAVGGAEGDGETEVHAPALHDLGQALVCRPDLNPRPSSGMTAVNRRAALIGVVLVPRLQTRALARVRDRTSKKTRLWIILRESDLIS